MVRIIAPPVLTAWLMTPVWPPLPRNSRSRDTGTQPGKTAGALFTETCRPTGLEREVDNDVLGNPKLELHFYGSRQ